MKISKTFLLTIALFCASSCFAGEPHDEMAIHTYGGGPLLEKVFNAIAMILYGNEKTGLAKSFHAILRLSLAIGGFCCFFLAIGREKFEPLIKTFFLPGLAVVGFFLIPRSTITIKDHIGQKTRSTAVWGVRKVDNVPFFLAKVATLVSEVSYRLEKLFTGSVHGVDEQMYNWTGNIYAGENIFRAKRCKISNPVLEDDFREFCRECVFRDIGIGLYSKDDLIKTPSILQFLEEHTSNIRTVFYKDPNDSKTSSQCLTCKEAMKRMNELFNGKQANAKEIILGELGNQIQFLLDQKEAGEEGLQKLIKQQIAIDILKEEIPGNFNSFAAKRAEILQKENQKILGALGASSIVAMRNFFEAAIYMVFPLVVIVSLLSFGIKTIIQWIQFVVWINTWPIFYIVVNFMLNSIWDLRKQAVFGTSPATLTIFSSEGLCDLYSSMESIAAIALAFIPYLSWIILQGGVSQMVYLASSIMSPAQTAASTASSEKTMGNYSFGNINLDSLNASNAQTFRQTYSGMLSHGSVSLDSGNQTTTHVPGQDDLYIKQANSYFREGISKTSAFSSSLQESLSSSESAVQESSRAVSTSLNESVNQGVGFVNAISKHLQHGENLNISDSSGIQKAVQGIQSISNEYAHAKGVSSDVAFREMLSGSMSAGLSAKIIGGKIESQMSTQDGVSSYTSDSESNRAAQSDSFQTHLQTLRNVSSSEVASILGSEDAKLHEDFTKSLNQTESAIDQWRGAYSRHEALSQVQSCASSENLSVHQDLNQGFVEFLKDRYQGDIGQIIEASDWAPSDPRKKALINDFVKDFLPGKISADIPEIHNHNLKNLETGPSPEAFEQSKSSFLKQMDSKIGHEFGSLEETLRKTKTSLKTENASYSQALSSEEQRVVLGGGVDESGTELPEGYELMREGVKNKVENGANITELKAISAVGKGISAFGSGVAHIWNKVYNEWDD